MHGMLKRQSRSEDKKTRETKDRDKTETKTSVNIDVEYILEHKVKRFEYRENPE